MEDHNVYHSEFRVSVELREGIGRDWSLWPEALYRGQGSERSSAVVALSDGLGVRSGERAALLGAGDCFLDFRRNCWGVREVGHAASLVVEWEPGAFGAPIESSFDIARISGRGLALLRTAARTIATPRHSPEDVRHAIHRVFEVLAAHGVPLRPRGPAAFKEEVSEQETIITSLIDRALSHRGGELVTVVDLEEASGWSERSLRRHMGPHLAKYHFNAHAWRELYRRWRLSTGLALMGSPKATTEEVAGLLGYSSPTAFCRAFASSGFPSPGAIRQLL